MNRTYSNQTIKRALERGREFAEMRRLDAEALAAQVKETTVTHKQTTHGPVPRPPDVSVGEALLDDWQGFIDEALEAVDKAAARERALSQSTTSSDRFRSLGGDS